MHVDSTVLFRLVLKIFQTLYLIKINLTHMDKVHRYGKAVTI